MFLRFLKDMYKNLKEIEKTMAVSKLAIEALQHSARIKIQNNDSYILENVGKILGFVILLVVITYTIHAIL